MKNFIFCFVLVFFINFMSGNAFPLNKNQNDGRKFENPWDLSEANYSVINFENFLYKYPVQKNQSQIISTSRPRLFVRADEAKIGRGLTLTELRLKANDPAYKDWIQLNDQRQGRGSMPMAMRYLLTGEKKYALLVGEQLANTEIPYREHTSTAAAVYHSAIAFDWVRNELPDEMAKKISEKLAEGAEHLKGGVRSPSINHNYSIVSLYGLSMAAIAIYGESEEMTQKSMEYIQLINNMLTNEHMLLETFQHKEGVWGEGNHYTPFVVYHPFLMTMRGLTTATNIDYFSLIRIKYGNFLKPMAKFVIANFRPDFTLERIGDVLGTVVPAGRFMRPLLELLASEIDDVVLQGQIRSFSMEMENYFPDPLVTSSNGWMMMVAYDSKLPDDPSYTTLPLAMRIGKDAYEHIMFRNSWDEDGTLISYISGDQYTHHQHLDKGHFIIYKKGGLTVDGGGYGSPMYGDNWANYSTRTIAHNCVLVPEPDEAPWEGTSGTLIYPDGGQRIQVGKQNHKSWQQFINEKDADGLNTADVIAFDYDRKLNQYNYVKSDLTKAYGVNVAFMERQLLYLPDMDYLVVKDRILSKKPLKKYWLLHFEQRPIINGENPGTGITEFNGESEVRSERTDKVVMGGRTTENSGALFIKSLLPGKRNITIIGGPGFEYYNHFANKNFPNSRPFEPIIEPGNWRMETSTANPETETVFLHALEITEANKKEMVETKYIETTDTKMDGVVFQPIDSHYVVLFSKNKDEKKGLYTTGLPVNYKMKATKPTKHFITELEPDKKVKIVINKNVFGTYSTSTAGILTFEDNGLGERNIQIIAE